jgi:hypothetical protein
MMVRAHSIAFRAFRLAAGSASSSSSRAWTAFSRSHTLMKTILEQGIAPVVPA